MSSFSNMPLEITLDILSRLPAKSVGQCRCVSMQWRSLLTRPEFIKTHLHRSTILRQESLTFLDRRKGFWYASTSNAHHVLDKITKPTTRLFSTVHPVFQCLRWVVASCNGLILFGGIEGKIFVVNPITREIRQVPPLGCLNYQHLTLGFGYDSVNDDCKVVAITVVFNDNGDGFLTDKPEMFVHVYSLRSGSWKRVQSSPCNLLKSNGAEGVFVDGHIHWIAYDDKDGTHTIAAFDLAEEKFSLVSSPYSIDALIISAFNFRLDVLGGCLCLLINTETENSVWVMKEYGVNESWTKFPIDGPELCRSRIQLMCALGREVVMKKDYEKLVLYNVKEGTSKDLVLDGMSVVRLTTARFVDSLVSPHGWWQ